MRSYTYHLRSLLRPLAFALSLALLTSVPTLLGMEGGGMMIASRNSFTVQIGNAEEEMYKELFMATVERTGIGDGRLDLVDIDIDTIGTYAYAGHENIGVVDLPAVTSIGAYAFSSSKIYGDITLSGITSFGGYRSFGELYFYGATVSLPNVTSLANQPFYQAFQYGRTSTVTFVTVELDSCTSIPTNGFYNSSGLKKLYAPRLQSIDGSSTFGSVGNVSAVGSVDLIVGDQTLGTGLTTSALVGLSGFPFGASTSGRVMFTCKDGTVTYDTAQGAWVQTPYS